jgi:rubrerythrin
MNDSDAPKYSFAELTTEDRLDADMMRSLYTGELGGEDFYNALADLVDNDEAATLLRRNGREEAGHARRLGRAIAILEGRDFEPTADMLERPPVSLPDDFDPERFLPSLIRGELSGDEGYRRWAENEPDEAVARLLRLNGREEAIHGRRAESALALLVG